MLFQFCTVFYWKQVEECLLMMRIYRENSWRLRYKVRSSSVKNANAFNSSLVTRNGSLYCSAQHLISPITTNTKDPAPARRRPNTMIGTSDNEHDGKNQAFLIHKGHLANIMSVYPPVETFTLSEGWDDIEGGSRAFGTAVQELVHRNPILSSHLEKRKDGLYAVRGTYPPETHQFAKTTQVAAGAHDLETLEGRQIFIQSELEPIVFDPNRKFCNMEIKNKTPLFDAHLFCINGTNMACYLIRARMHSQISVHSTTC